MRISLLRQREPFAPILEATLADFWSTQSSRATEVRWSWSPRHRPPRRSVQRWYANVYLNAIFVPPIDNASLNPIRQEFGRSAVAWRRPWQRAYVAAATSRLGRCPLAHAAMDVWPPIPEAGHLLLIPGNRKIRLLNRRQGTSTCILKSGWDPRALAAEIETRRQVEQLGLPVPRLLRTPADGRWFEETYVCGTPLNRLASPTDRQWATGQSLAALRRLVAKTQHDVDSLSYLRDRAARVQRTIDLIRPRQPTITAAIEPAVHELFERLHSRARQFDCVTLAMTHGDFQAANILLAEGLVWLIDWEHAQLRPGFYDPMVLGLMARCPAGLSHRLWQFVRDPGHAAGLSSEWPGANGQSSEQRVWMAELFLLEEWAWHLSENTQPQLRGISPGLAQMVHEWQAWQERNTLRTTLAIGDPRS